MTVFVWTNYQDFRDSVHPWIDKNNDGLETPAGIAHSKTQHVYS